MYRTGLLQAQLELIIPLLETFREDKQRHHSWFHTASTRKGLDMFSYIGDKAPAFRVHASQIKVLREPVQFFETLKSRARSAKSRIVLASLYLGNGELEQELVDCLYEASEKSKFSSVQPTLQVRVLLDYTRGSRGEHNSRTMLLPLLRDFTDSVQVALYHTPNLRGFYRWLLRGKFSETVGLQHMKIYLFDNSIIISGANLSSDYFTNRQDRYMLLENCQEMADWFESLVEAVSQFSYHLQTDDTVKLSMNWDIDPVEGDYNEFQKCAKQIIENVYYPNPVCINHNQTLASKPITNNSKGQSCLACDTKQNESSHEEQRTKQVIIDNALDDSALNSGGDTVIYLLVQMGQLGVTCDYEITDSLLRKAPQDAVIKLASGYFNLTEEYCETIIQDSRADFQLLMASPEVMGFYGASGILGSIPPAYVYIAKIFYERVCELGQQHRIKLQEFFRENWTFHAKGLWYYLPGQKLPCMTLIGSPNFGYRSVHRDTELQLAIVTDNEKLQQELHKEQEHLYSFTSEVTAETFVRPDRYVPIWVRYVIRVIKHYF